MVRIHFNKIGRSQISWQSVTSKNKTFLDPRFSDDNKLHLILKKIDCINYVHNNDKIAIRNSYYSPVSNSRYHSIGQGWAQDLLGRDRDQDRDLSSRDRDLSSRDRDETETFAKLSETRLRRDPRVSETRPRRDLFLVETISAYICMVYTYHCVPKKESLRLYEKKQVNNKQSLILKIPKTFMFVFI